MAVFSLPLASHALLRRLPLASGGARGLSHRVQQCLRSPLPPQKGQTWGQKAGKAGPEPITIKTSSKPLNRFLEFWPSPTGQKCKYIRVILT